MNYKSFNLGDWIGHISGVIEDETTLDGNEMRDLVEFLSTLEQEPILDKLRAEIEQTTSRYCISRERGGSGQVEWSDRLIKESEVLEIIDKYKVESEDKG